MLRARCRASPGDVSCPWGRKPRERKRIATPTSTAAAFPGERRALPHQAAGASSCRPAGRLFSGTRQGPPAAPSVVAGSLSFSFSHSTARYQARAFLASSQEACGEALLGLQPPAPAQPPPSAHRSGLAAIASVGCASSFARGSLFLGRGIQDVGPLMLSAFLSPEGQPSFFLRLASPPDAVPSQTPALLPNSSALGAPSPPDRPPSHPAEDNLGKPLLPTLPPSSPRWWISSPLSQRALPKNPAQTGSKI